MGHARAASATATAVAIPRSGAPWHADSRRASAHGEETPRATPSGPKKTISWSQSATSNRSTPLLPT